MNVNDLTKLAKEFAMEYWGMEFNVPIIINNRLRNSLGRMCFNLERLTGKIIPTKLEMAGITLSNYNNNTIIGILKHELCHWALAMQGKPFNDGHPVFEKELQRIGAPSTNTIQSAGTVYTVCCSSCKKQIAESMSEGRLKKYVYGAKRKEFKSACCEAKIEWGPTKYIEDTNDKADNTQPREVQRAQRIAAMTVASTSTLEKPEIITNLDEILVPGPRGVTNKQMIPAIKKAIDLENKELINELKTQFPSVFESSYKYLNKMYKSKYEILMS